MVNQVETAVRTPRRRSGLRKYRRFGGSLVSVVTTLFLLVLLTFVIGRLMPVDPVIAVVGPDADRATYLKVQQELGLDLPVLQQFWIFFKNLLHGDFGTTLLTGRPVMEDIARVLPATVELATVTIILGAGIGIPLGVYAAVNRGRFADHAVRLIALAWPFNTDLLDRHGRADAVLCKARLGWRLGPHRSLL